MPPSSATQIVLIDRQRSRTIPFLRAESARIFARCSGDTAAGVSDFRSPLCCQIWRGALARTLPSACLSVGPRRGCCRLIGGLCHWGWVCLNRSLPDCGRLCLLGPLFGRHGSLLWGLRDQGRLHLRRRLRVRSRLRRLFKSILHRQIPLVLTNKPIFVICPTTAKLITFSSSPVEIYFELIGGHGSTTALFKIDHSSPFGPKPQKSPIGNKMDLAALVQNWLLQQLEPTS